MDYEKICIMFLKGESLENIIDKYKIDYQKVVKIIIYYCKRENIQISEDIKERLEEPIKNMYDLRNKNFSFEEIAKKYYCKIHFVKNAIRKYRKKNHLFSSRKNSIKNSLPLDVIYEFKRQGISYEEIAQLYECSAVTISKNLKEYCEEKGLPIPSIYESINPHIKEVYELKKNGKTYSEIADKFNCSKSTVCKHLKNFLERQKLSLEKNEENFNLNPEEIYKLRISGMTYEEIAEKYNRAHSTIYNIILKYCSDNNLLFPDVSFFLTKKIWKLREDGKSIKEIAKSCKCSIEIVNKALEEYEKKAYTEEMMLEFKINLDKVRKIYTDADETKTINKKT